jgi:aryl-alcohol dehydrogenase-like predicted oxidoreductase
MKMVLGSAFVLSGYGRQAYEVESRIDDFLSTLSEATELGVHFVDTAPTYGDAESLIGASGAPFNVISKVQAQSGTPLETQIGDSLERLGMECLYACLIHDWSSMGDQQRIDALEALLEVSDRGLIKKAGFSAYSPEELRLLEGKAFQNVLVQVPANPLDQRFAKDARTRSLADEGVEFHARSIFLQGRLIAIGDDVQADLPEISRYRDWCKSRNLSPVSAAVRYVHSLEWVSALVLGARNPVELRDLYALSKEGPLSPSLRTEMQTLSSSSLSLIDPREWSDR